VVDQQAIVDNLSRNTIPRIIQTIIQTNRSQELSLDTRLRSDSVVMQEVPLRAISGANLQRQLTQSQSLADMFRQQYTKAQLAALQTAPDLQVFQYADVPSGPSSDQRPRLRFLAVLASFAAGIALALLRDRFNSRFRYPEHATIELGLTIAGTVPKFHVN